MRTTTQSHMINYRETCFAYENVLWNRNGTQQFVFDPNKHIFNHINEKNCQQQQ